MSRTGGRQATSTTHGPAAPLALQLSGALAVRRLRTAFVVVAVLLAAGHLLAVALLHGVEAPGAEGFGTFLSLRTEQGPGTWVAGMVHLLCALLAVATALAARATAVGWQKSWWLLGGVFTFLSFDEVAAFHDRMTSGLSDAVGGTSGALTFAWVVPYLVLGAAFLAVQVPFLLHLGRTGRDLVLAGIVFVAGAAGLEMVQGVLATSDQNEGVAYELLVMVEELLEVGGIMWAALILARHLARALDGTTLSFRSG